MGSRKQTLITIMKMKTFTYMTAVAGMDSKSAMAYVTSETKKWSRRTTADLEIIAKGM